MSVPPTGGYSEPRDYTPATRMKNREKAIQSHEVADIVFQEFRNNFPNFYPPLSLTYGIAEAVWDAGYRKETT